MYAERTILNRKTYEELEFTDDFMFANILYSNTELCRKLVELLLNRKVTQISAIDYQKTIDIRYDSKGIRLDVIVEDAEHNTYDLEMQIATVESLPKRCRYYHSMMALDQIQKSEDYEKLNPTYVIFICKNGIREGMDRAIYSFRNRCDEDSSIELGDETYTILINASSESTDIPEEMRSFIRYIRTGKDDGSSSLVGEIETNVREARTHERWRAEYMTQQMRDLENRKLGREEGIEIGKKAGIQETLRIISEVKDKLLSEEEAAKRLGISVEELRQMLS